MYTQLVTGDVPGAATYFNPLLAQTIVPATSGARPSSPPEGMLIYESDTKRYVAKDPSGWNTFGNSQKNTSYQPQLTATSTDPTLGSGSSRLSWYTQLPGSVLVYNFLIKFGSSGAAAGTGQYLVSLPFNSGAPLGTDPPAMGVGLIRDSSAGSTLPVQCYIPGTNPAVLAFILTGTGGSVTNTAPWTWAAGDYLSGSITYCL